MTDLWNPKMSYVEGERCRYGGAIYEARFDLCRGLKPNGAFSEKFWRRVPTIPAKSQASPYAERGAPAGYITRALGYYGEKV